MTLELPCCTKQREQVDRYDTYRAVGAGPAGAAAAGPKFGQKAADVYGGAEPRL